MKETGSCHSSLARQVSLKTTSRSWIQKLLWGCGRNSEHGTEKWAFVVWGLSASAPCFPLTSFSSPPSSPLPLTARATVAPAAALSSLSTSSITCHSTVPWICTCSRAARAQLCLFTFMCSRPNLSPLEWNCSWRKVFKEVIKLKWGHRGDPNPMWLESLEETMWRHGRKAAKERGLRRHQTAGTLILNA